MLIFLHLFLQIYGSGEQTRSFQYVSDLVEGLVALMNSNYTQPVNLGNPIERTINGKYKIFWKFCFFHIDNELRSETRKRAQKSNVMFVLLNSTIKKISPVFFFERSQVQHRQYCFVSSVQTSRVNLKTYKLSHDVAQIYKFNIMIKAQRPSSAFFCTFISIFAYQVCHLSYWTQQQKNQFYNYTYVFLTSKNRKSVILIFDQ